MTGVQTCALPIYPPDLVNKYHRSLFQPIDPSKVSGWQGVLPERDVRVADLIVGAYSEKAGYERKYTMWNFRSLIIEIGRASCRERV